MNAFVRPDDAATRRAAEFARDAEVVRAELEKAVVDAGLSEDAFGAVLRGLSSALGIIAEAPDVILAAGQPVVLSPENQRELLRNARGDIARGAHVAMADAIRWINPASLAIIAGVLFVIVPACLGGGWWWGHSTARADLRATEEGIRTAFANGPEAAKDWWALIAWNDPRKALAECKGTAVYVQAGRKACAVPLWIEGPQAPGQRR